jgi:hypothetical protein
VIIDYGEASVSGVTIEHCEEQSGEAVKLVKRTKLIRAMSVSSSAALQSPTKSAQPEIAGPTPRTPEEPEELGKPAFRPSSSSSSSAPWGPPTHSSLAGQFGFPVPSRRYTGYSYLLEGVVFHEPFSTAGSRVDSFCSIS